MSVSDTVFQPQYLFSPEADPSPSQILDSAAGPGLPRVLLQLKSSKRYKYVFKKII